MLIGICGKMGSGKDTVANYLLDRYNCPCIAFAEPVKEIVKDLFNVKGKSERARELYQKVGEFMRSIDEDVWVKKLIAKYNDSYRFNYDVTVISDVRYPNEVKAILGVGGIVIMLHVPEHERKRRIEKRDGITISDEKWKEMNEHESEISVDLIKDSRVKHVYVEDEDIDAVNKKVNSVMLRFIHKEYKSFLPSR